MEHRIACKRHGKKKFLFPDHSCSYVSYPQQAVLRPICSVIVFIIVVIVIVVIVIIVFIIVVAAYFGR